MKDINFTDKDWRNLRKAMWKNTRGMSPRELYELYMYYPNPKNDGLVLEMAIHLNEYKDLIAKYRNHLLYTMCNICCLEYLCMQDVRHWLMEIKECVFVLADKTLKDNHKKDNAVETLLVEYSKVVIKTDMLYKEALMEEIRKGEKENTYNAERKQKDVTYIKEIINDIPEIRKQNEKRMLDCIKSIAKVIISFRHGKDKKVNEENFNKMIPPVLYGFMESNPNFEFDEDMFKVK